MIALESYIIVWSGMLFGMGMGLAGSSLFPDRWSKLAMIVVCFIMAAGVRPFVMAMTLP